MRCFVHAEVDAVGCCRSCQRGVCGACAVDVGKSLACRDRCESDVRDSDRMLAWSLKMMDSTSPTMPDVESELRSARSSGRAAAYLNLALGIAFTAWGMLDKPRIWFLVMIGGCMLAYGVFELLKSRRS